MQQRYFEGGVQPLAPGAGATSHSARRSRRRAASSTSTSPSFAFHRGLEALWRALDHANKYVTETAPFSLAKDPAKQPRVGAILHELCEALRVTAQLVAPFLPETAARELAALLGFPEADLADLDLPWGGPSRPATAPSPPTRSSPASKRLKTLTGAYGVRYAVVFSKKVLENFSKSLRSNRTDRTDR